MVLFMACVGKDIDPTRGSGLDILSFFEFLLSLRICVFSLDLTNAKAPPISFPSPKNTPDVVKTEHRSLKSAWRLHIYMRPSV